MIFLFDDKFVVRLFSVEIDGYDETVQTQYFSENKDQNHADE